MSINIFEAVFTAVIYIVSLMYVYRMGYASGARKILGEWRGFINRLKEEEDNE